MAAEETGEKTARLGFRVTPAQKDLLTQAAALEGTDVTNFVLARALSYAREVVQMEQVTVVAAESRAAYQAWLDEDARSLPGMRRLADVEPFETR